MPVHETEKNGKTKGFKYGNSGKEYLISKWGKSEAKKKAILQAYAIKKSQERAGKKVE